MNFDYKKIGIIVLSVISFVLIIIIIFPSKTPSGGDKPGIVEEDNPLLININDIEFSLKGDINYELNSNEEYIEPGFVAKIKNGEDISEFVTIKNDYVINNGKYKIKYYLEYENIKTTLTRYITIKNIADKDIEIEQGDDITLKLNGADEIYVLKNNQFKDSGVSAISKKDGDISSKVINYGIVDTSKVGDYTLKYTIRNSLNEEKTIERHVIVYDLNYQISFDRLSDKINLKINVNDDYIKYFVINNEVKFAIKGINTFNISDNMEHTLKIVDKYNYEKIEKFNFIKPTLSCSATINSNNTVVSITSKSNDITKYYYYFNNQKYESSKTNYSITGSFKNVSVEAVNINNNTSKVSCTVTENKPVPYFDSGLKELSYDGWNYYLYVPSNVRQNEKRPLVVFLHGSEERGTNLKSLDSYGFAKYIKKGQTYDSFILMPQLPKSKYWANSSEVDKTMALIKKVVNDYNINESKISLSGFSLGAIGIPSIMKKNQNYFSSVVMIAVGGDKKGYASYFKNIPVRFYAGSKDTKLGNSSQTKEFIKAVQKVNSNVESVVFKDAPHNVVDKTLKDGTVYNWMISQTKK